MTTGRKEIVEMLSAREGDLEALFSRAAAVRKREVGDRLYLRGLIEYSNLCRKNCFYCGIRSGTPRAMRYTLSDTEVLDAARYALENRFGSVVLQGGEMQGDRHTERIESLVRGIKALSDGALGITLSLGEQSADTYRRWFEAGAHRYLLRIESSSRRIYERIHPADGRHRFDDRLRALCDLREVGYQVGTGVMIGLPGQTVEDLAGDICFMRDFDIDMCGMGPYVEAEGTPLQQRCGDPPPRDWRLLMSLRMIAALRIVMPDINIAAATSLGSLSPDGRLDAVRCGANVVMPNVTPGAFREQYALYDGKSSAIDYRLLINNVAFGRWGDSIRFGKKNK